MGEVRQGFLSGERGQALSTRPLTPGSPGNPRKERGDGLRMGVLPPWLLYRVYKLLRGNQKEREHSLLRWRGWCQLSQIYHNC